MPDDSSVTQSSNSSVYSGSPWQSGSYGTNSPSGLFGPAANPKGLKILVLNGGAAEGAGTALSVVLKKLGFHCARGYPLSFARYLKKDIIFFDEDHSSGIGSSGKSYSNPTRRSS